MDEMIREYHGIYKDIQNDAMSWGIANEPTAIAMFEFDTGINVDHAPFFEYGDWAGATPDGLIGDDAILEVKCPYRGIREMLPQYYAQLQWEMMCSNRSKYYFYQWTPEKTSLDEGEIDREWLDINIPVLKDFHNEFLDKAKRSLVKNNYANNLVQEYFDTKKQKDELDAHMKKVMEEIIDLSGGEEQLIGDHKLKKVTRKGSIKWKDVPFDVEPYRGKDVEYWRLT